MGKFANDPKVYDELNASVANLNAITTKLRNGEGSLGQLLNDPALAKSLNATTANLEGVTGRLNRGEGTAGQAAHRRCALQAAGFADCPARHGSAKPERRPGHGRPAAARQAVI